MTLTQFVVAFVFVYVALLLCLPVDALPPDEVRVKIRQSTFDMGPKQYNIVGVLTDPYDKKLTNLEVEACNKMFTFTYKNGTDLKVVAEKVSEALFKVCGW